MPPSCRYAASTCRRPGSDGVTSSAWRTCTALRRKDRMESGMSVPDDYLSDVTRRFRDLKTLADRAIAQAPDAGLFTAIDDASNSIAVLMQHLAGNMRSRWHSFLTTDGEKPDRNRDGEFEAPPTQTRAAMVADWESGWNEL